ncbi:MAG TPA: hypothetical protein VFC40_03445 [Syntrophomonas sp.]|nr:hypothetical protein [Syntrophomonas sp.]
MQENVTIWSSVIVAQLPDTRTCQQKREVMTSEKYRRIEDLKTRISARQVKVEGKSAEIKVNVESLTLLEDDQGNLHPYSRRDIIKERIPLALFDALPEEYQELRYIVEIKDFYGDAVLQGKNLIIIYYLSYMLLATREQMVTLQPAAIEADQRNAAPVIQPSHDQTNPRLADNIILRRQLQLYETNLQSIKKSLQKAETNNSALSRELKGLQAGQAEDSPNQMGKRIKNIFLNNA